MKNRRAWALNLLVEIENVDSALFVCDLDVTQVLFECHIDHLLRDLSTELT